jgi:hypothetical protein
MLWMKKEAYEDSTIEYTAKRLRARKIDPATIALLNSLAIRSARLTTRSLFET